MPEREFFETCHGISIPLGGLYVAAQKDHLSIKWTAERGFGLNEITDVPAYGQKPVEFYREPSLMLRRAAQLLDDGVAGSLGLKELRELHSLSQTELAHRLGVRQAAVSRVERRQDLHLDTLHAIVGALGRVLELRVKFPGCEVPLKVGGPTGCAPESRA